MNVFEIDVGGITYDVEADSEEEAVKAANAFHLGEAAMNRSIEALSSRGPAKPGFLDRFDNSGRAVARGVPIAGAFADEIAAVGNTALSYPIELINENVTGFVPRDEDWRKAMSEDMPFRDRVSMALRKERAKDEEFDKKHPFVSTAGKLAGAGLGGAAMLKMFPWMLGGEGLFGQMAAGGASGSVIAGAHTYGENEGDFSERMEGVPEAAGLGLVLGAGFPALFRGGEWLYGKAKQGIDNMTGLFGMPSKAERKVVDLMADDAVTAEMLRNMDRPGVVAMNASDDALALGKEIASTPGPAGKKIVEAAKAQKNLIKQAAGSVGSDVAGDEMINRAVENAEDIINAGGKASTRIAKDVAAALGGPRTMSENPGITRSMANLTGLLGTGAGDKLTQIAISIGNAFRSGRMDRNYLEAARMLMSSGPEVAGIFMNVVASRAATEAQARAITTILKSLVPGAISQSSEAMRTGGRF